MKLLTKVEKERYRQLKSNGDYEQIFEEFSDKFGDKLAGKLFRKASDKKYKKEDLKKLRESKDLQTAMRKYESSDVKKLKRNITYDDILAEHGLVQAIAYRVKNLLKDTAINIGILGTTAALTLGAVTTATVTDMIKDNSVKYETQIAEYNKSNEEYAKKIQSMNLNDIQTFMQVMSDMWKSIDGYSNPQENICRIFRT